MLTSSLLHAVHNCFISPFSGKYPGQWETVANRAKCVQMEHVISLDKYFSECSRGQLLTTELPCPLYLNIDIMQRHIMLLQTYKTGLVFILVYILTDSHHIVSSSS